MHRHDSGPAAPYAAVLLDVAAVPVDGSVAAGLATPDGDHVLATLSARSRRVAISVRPRRAHPGAALPQDRAGGVGAFRLAFALCENQVTALVDTGDGWKAALTERTQVAGAGGPPPRPDVLGGHRYAWGGGGVRLGARGPACSG